MSVASRGSSTRGLMASRGRPASSSVRWKISPAAAALYAGAEQTKYGLKVVMHDKVAAMEKLFKHLGLYEKDNEQKTDPLTALLQSISGANASAFRPVAHDPEAMQASAFEPQPGDDPGDD